MLCFGYLGIPDSIDHYYYKANSINQKLLKLKTDRAIHDISIKYDVEKKEQALFIAEQENEKAALSNTLKQRTIYILMAVIAIFALVVVIFYILYREKQKLIELEVRSKNDEIEKLIKDQEIKTYQAQLAGIEKERERVAQDLHDRIGGLLATVKLQFEGNDIIDNSVITTVKSLVNESIQTVRSISHDLTDGRVDDLGLIPSIENLKESFTNSSKINFDLYLENYNVKYPVEKEREIFKIILELLSNTLKHANATQIVLQINTIENVVHFTFEDNGIGFNPSKVKKGIGMRSISKRVDQLNGSWYIDSKKGHGSTTIIEIPLK
jgi:signal transduction histidine kinase